MKKRVKVYVHRDREDNWPIVESMKLKGDAADEVECISYQTDLLFEVDTETGKHNLIGAGGFFLGEESYSKGDVDIDEGNLGDEDE